MPSIGPVRDLILRSIPSTGWVRSSADWFAARFYRWSVAFLALAAALLWGFVELADEVIEGETHAVDERLILVFRSAIDRSDPIGPVWLEEMVRDFTALGSTGVLAAVTVAVFGFLLIARAPKAAVALALAVSGGALVSSLMKLGFDRPRPDLVPHGATVYSASFPSGHSMMAAVVFLTIGTMLARVLSGFRLRAYVIAVCIVLSLAVGISRVYLGVHWPTDVLAGWLVGSAWALLCGALMLRLQLSHAVETEIHPEAPAGPPLG